MSVPHVAATGRLPLSYPSDHISALQSAVYAHKVLKQTYPRLALHFCADPVVVCMYWAKHDWE